MTTRPKKTARKAPGRRKTASRKTSGKTATPPQAATKRPPAPGYLTPDEFAAICYDALGGRGWQKAFMSGTGLAQSTVTRYLKGIFPIPQYVAMICRLLQMLRSNGVTLPDEFTPPLHRGRRDPE
jgi:hypothetical protein